MAINRAIFLILIFYTALFAQSGSQPVNVLIQNSSFEQVPVHPFNQDPCGPWIPGEVPGWTITPLQVGAGAGVLKPASPSPINNPNCLGGISPAPDGVTVAYLAGASISQNLSTAQPVGVYTLNVYFADRFYWYPAQYSASLIYGTTQQCETSGLAMGDFTQITLVCPIFHNPTPQPLTLKITGNGTFQLLLDKVSLVFTPIN